MRRFWISLIIVILVGLVVIGIYFGWRRSDTRTPPVTLLEPPTVEPPPTINLAPTPANAEEAEQYRFKPRVFLEKDPDGLNYLKITDTKEKTKVLTSLNLEDVEAVPALPDRIFLVERPTASAPTSIWVFDTAKKTLNYLVQDELGLMMNWSPSGNLALKFSNGVFSLVNFQTGKTIELPFTTLPNKCVFVDDNKFYCAVPQNFNSKIILPDDYLKNKWATEDEILSLTLEPLRFETILEREQGILDAVDLKIINNKLLFVDRYDNKIYKIQL